MANKARLAISWPTSAINADPLPSEGQYPRVIGLVSPIGPSTPQAVGGSRQKLSPAILLLPLDRLVLRDRLPGNARLDCREC